LAYEVSLTREAEKQLADILKAANEAERQRFQRAFEELRKNPYPTNRDVPPATIRRLRGSGDWRYKVSSRYRMLYSIAEHTVIVRRVMHRKDIYKDL